MAEKSALGIVEIILHAICAVICCRVLVDSAIAIADITDLFKDDGEDLTAADDRDKYRDVAVWLLSIGFAGLTTQIIIAIIRGLYYGEIITSWFAIFGITSAILSIVLAFALISGGIVSAVNAADIQEEYIDPLEDICSQDDLTDEVEEICNKLQAIRNAQVSSAASAFLGAVTAVVATMLLLVCTTPKRDK